MLILVIRSMQYLVHLPFVCWVSRCLVLVKQVVTVSKTKQTQPSTPIADERGKEVAACLCFLHTGCGNFVSALACGVHDALTFPPFLWRFTNERHFFSPNLLPIWYHSTPYYDICTVGSAHVAFKMIWHLLLLLWVSQGQSRQNGKFSIQTADTASEKYNIGFIGGSSILHY